MFHRMVRGRVRKGFADISRGDFDPVLQQFAPDIHFSFAGSHAIQGDFHQRESVKRWFERLHRLFPGLTITPQHIIVSGLPLDIRSVTQFSVAETLPDGQPYHNAGVQILRIKWGKIVEDHLVEDTDALLNALRHLAALGVEEALAPGLEEGGEPHE